MTQTSWRWPADLVGMRVYDLNGLFLGRVASRKEDALDVELAPRAKRLLEAPHHVAVPLSEIIAADERTLTLRDAAEFEAAQARLHIGE